MADFVANESDWVVDEDTMASLNEQWMEKTGPTDVLAFPMDELDDARGRDDHDPSPALLGDIVICPEVAAAQAKSVGHSLDDEMHVLCAHGVLHLLGYDHGDPAEEQEMFGQQAKLLASWSAARAAGPTA